MLLRAPLNFVSATASAPGASPSPSSAIDTALARVASTPRDGHDALPAAEFAAWTRTASDASNGASHDGAEGAASFGVRMLARMGFRQRLGRHETGIINPVSLVSHTSSAGLGFSDSKRKVRLIFNHVQ